MITDHFPFDSMREIQAKALAFIEKSINDGKKTIILEAPTGVGKTPIAYAIAKWATTVKGNDGTSGADILTANKLLQQQYMNDFKDMGLVEIKGKNNYPCHTSGTNCEEGSIQNGGACSNCPYACAKKEYIDNGYGISNFSYFLHETEFAHQLPRRRILILDEGHNIEKQILEFAGVTITTRKMTEIGVGRIPEVKNNVEAMTWLRSTVVPLCADYILQLRDQMESLTGEQRVRIAMKASSYIEFQRKINEFLNSEYPDSWLVYNTKEGLEAGIVIKPLTAAMHAQSILFSKADITIILSATILDFTTFASCLGVDTSTLACMRLSSPFHPKNRVVHFKPVGKMSWKEKDATLPAMLSAIDKILAKHKDVKGIIHTHSYALNKQIADYLRHTEHRGRILTHTNAPGSKEMAIEDHMFDPKSPTVLLSPAMTEGVDLANDWGRFCIIPKVPYPSLDTYTKARLKISYSWYAWLTVLAIVQATGRTTRSVDDYSTCYILDADFGMVLKRNAKIIPSWWLDGLKVHAA